MVSVSVESAVRTNPPCLSGWGWTGSDFARHNQCTVDCSLRRLERIGSDGSEISAGGGVDVNVEGLHGLAIRVGCFSRCCEHRYLKIVLPEVHDRVGVGAG